MGLNTLLRLTSVTLLAFVLVVLTVNWGWRRAGRVDPTVLISYGTVRMSWDVPASWLPTAVPAAGARRSQLGTVARTRALSSNPFWGVYIGFEAAYRYPLTYLREALAQGNGLAQRPYARVRPLALVELRTPLLGLLLVVALVAEGIRHWRDRHCGSRKIGPSLRLALASLVSGLTLFALVVLALTVSHKLSLPGKLLPMATVSPGTVELFYESHAGRPSGAAASVYEPPPMSYVFPPEPKYRRGRPELVLRSKAVKVERITINYSLPWLTHGTLGNNASRRLTLYPPFFAVLLVVAVGLLAKGRRAIPALGGRAGFGVEPKPTEGRQEP